MKRQTVSVIVIGVVGISTSIIIKTISTSTEIIHAFNNSGVIRSYNRVTRLLGVPGWVLILLLFIYCAAEYKIKIKEAKSNSKSSGYKCL